MLFLNIFFVFYAFFLFFKHFFCIYKNKKIVKKKKYFYEKIKINLKKNNVFLFIIKKNIHIKYAKYTKIMYNIQKKCSDKNLHFFTMFDFLFFVFYNFKNLAIKNVEYFAYFFVNIFFVNEQKKCRNI